MYLIFEKSGSIYENICDFYPFFPRKIPPRNGKMCACWTLD